jgi:uncharacterized membrane protein YdjX (TVP38/TMEM64 family)
MLAIRLLPIPHLIVNAAAAVSAMRWRDFALGTLIGTLPNLFLYTYFASSLVEGVLGGQRRAVMHLVIAVGLLVSLSLLPKLIKRSRTR